MERFGQSGLGGSNTHFTKFQSVAHQPPVPVVEHCILCLCVLMPVRRHPPQFAHNVEVLWAPLVQMVIDVICAPVSLLHSRGFPE